MVGFLLLVSGRISCAFASIVGQPCPACGSTRAMLALANLDFAGVVRFNPVAPFFSALVALLALQALVSVYRTGTLQGVGSGRVGVLVVRAALGLAVVQFILWLLRFAGALGGPVPV